VLDDELFLHRRSDFAPLRLAQHLRREPVVVRLSQPEPGRQLVASRITCVAFVSAFTAITSPALPGSSGCRRGVRSRPVAMAHKLACLTARGGEAEAHEDIVEAALEQRQQVLAGDAGHARGLLVVVAELALQQAVVAPRLLLFAQLERYSDCFWRPRPCSPGG